MPRRVFITGGASGLGRALAERFARARYDVCVADLNDARGADTLRTLKNMGVSASYLHCDVTRDEDLAAAVAHVEDLWGGVDIVVNNAGVAQAGAIDAISLDDWRFIVDVNLLGVVRGCKAFTPLFRRQKSGHFVNVASMAGLLDVPMMSSYNATKAAVVSLSETMDNELADDGIVVSVVCPSFFKTNLGESMRTSDPSLHAKMERLLERGALSADDVADAVFRGVEARHLYILPHRAGEVTWLLKRFLPRPIYAALIRRQSRGMRSRPR